MLLFLISLCLLFFLLKCIYSFFCLDTKGLPKDRDVPKKSRTTPIALPKISGICLPTFHYLLVTFSLEGKRTPEEVKNFFALSFVLIQKKQKIKDNPIAPRVCPARARQKPGDNI
jgi:hypothetical protein